MALSARILPHYTYDDYLLWEGEWEIIDGIAYAMSPMASPKHQLIANKLGSELEKKMSEAPCDCNIYQPIDVKIAEDTVVHPDLLIVCGAIEKQYLDFPPELVVEILSPSTKLRDQITKKELYQDFGIRYYLIVDPDTKAITYYALNQEGKYEEVSPPDSFHLAGGCSISPDLQRVLNAIG